MEWSETFLTTKGVFGSRAIPQVAASCLVHGFGWLRIAWWGEYSLKNGLSGVAKNWRIWQPPCSHHRPRVPSFGRTAVVCVRRVCGGLRQAPAVCAFLLRAGGVRALIFCCSDRLFYACLWSVVLPLVGFFYSVYYLFLFKILYLLSVVILCMKSQQTLPSRFWIKAIGLVPQWACLTVTYCHI